MLTLDINGKKLVGRLDDAQCTDCHPSKAERPELHTKHKAGSPGSRCVSCHMPFVQETAVGAQILYTRSDHTISIPRSDLDEKLGVVNACRTCHTDRTNQQLGDDTFDWLLVMSLEDHEETAAELESANVPPERVHWL